MKLVYAIVRKDNEDEVMNELTVHRFSVTKLATTGGFLRKGNSTLMIGVEDDKVKQVIDIIKHECGERQKITVNMPYVSGPAMVNYSTMPMTVEVGGATIFLGVSLGYAAGTTNPFNIAVAQDVAGVELYSGMGLRWAIFIAFEILAITYLMRYASKVKSDPARSLLHGVPIDSVESKGLDDLDGIKMTTRQKLCLLEFFGVIAFLTYSVLNLGWYVDEIAALFLMAMVVAGIISGYSATEICKTFIESTKSMVSSMLIVGFTRGITVLMQQGCITDTIVYNLVNLLENASKYVAAYGMLILQNIIKFFINGSTSQATITMPIMAPTAELVGLSKQIAVLAYQFGNGFADCFWPTSCALCCGLMGGVPLNKWYRFVTPLFLMMLVLEFVFMTIAVWIGY